jgi:hypothetical protein
MMRAKRLQHRFVETMPEMIEPGILYVSMEYATAAHRCCCITACTKLAFLGTPTVNAMQCHLAGHAVRPVLGSG